MIDRLRALLDEGTPGRLEKGEPGRDLVRGCRCGSCYDYDWTILVVGLESDAPMTPADARLIAAARNLLGPLLDVANAARVEWECFCPTDPDARWTCDACKLGRATDALGAAIRAELGES